MTRSSKKHSKTAPKDEPVTNHDEAILHDMMNGRSKKKKKKQIQNLPINIDHSIQSFDNNININIHTSLAENTTTYQSKCPCDTHFTKQLIESSYNIPVDRLFDLIFGSNEFVRTYRTAQNFFDQTETEWKMNEQTKNLERILNYKVPFETRLFGKSTIITRETQKRCNEMPGSHYIVETEVCNQGVKFSDTFALIIRFCLVQISPMTTSLLVTARVQYVKPVYGVIKQFIERNAYTASQDGVKDLNARLNRLKAEAHGSLHLTNGEPKNVESLVGNASSSGQQHAPFVDQSSLSIPVRDNAHDNNHTNQDSLDQEKIMYILIILVCFLAVIHVYLYSKLTSTDYFLEKLTHLLKK